MSVRAVDMQHTLQQAQSAERVQAVDRSQAEQQGQQFAQQFERAEAQRRTTVPQTDQTENGRISDHEREGRERRREAREQEARAEEEESKAKLIVAEDGQVHLIDIRV